MSGETHPEIVIIRRGGHGDHDEHHGGVWKIAFADFMTAMMAFFLVMWLISANDKTRASVARYFNPVRLVDATTQPRGLHDTKKDESGITASPDTKQADDNLDKKDVKPSPPPSDGKKAETPKDREKRLDSALRENPYVALAEIATTKAAGEASTKTPPRPSSALGRRGGEAFRDPFAPPPPLPPGKGDDAEDIANPSTDVMPDAKPMAAAEKQREEAAAVLASIKAGARDPAGPEIDVRPTAEGLLVSLTDTASFSMFSNGSAVPARRVVLLMEKVAQALKSKPGAIIVRGFTDNKPFRSTRYDNWHLSLDRAQVAHYMLVRGGLDDARIGHVEGYADRHGMPNVDAGSPLNRRIEILIKGAGK